MTDQTKSLTWEGKDGPTFQRGKNHLLLIGIDQYQHVAKLNNAVRDAQALRDLLLAKYSFQSDYLTEIYDAEATRRQLTHQLREMIERVDPQDNLLVYFSGHGHYDPVIKEGYWVPVDAEYKEIDDYVSYSFLLKVIEAIPSQHTVFIVDSCYSGAALVRDRDLHTDRVEQDPSRWLIASGRNEVVPDGVPGAHSPFADKLLDILNRYSHEGLRLGTLTDKLITAVAHSSEQTPIGRPLYGVGDQGGEFVFHPTPQIQNRNQEQDELKLTQPTESPIGASESSHQQIGVLASGNQIQPNKTSILRRRWMGWGILITLLLGGVYTLISWDKWEREPSDRGKAGVNLQDFQLPPYQLVPIQGDSFQMGNTQGREQEQPVHPVKIGRFEIGETEVTQALWQAVMGHNPSKFTGDSLPVENVSWEDCQQFIKKLNRQTGLSFRLPTEAEWEYAAGGGSARRSTYSGTNGKNLLEAFAWYNANSPTCHRPVGLKRANSLGLHDMSGNVWEWCEDHWHETYHGAPADGSAWTHSDSTRRINRGGGWNGGADLCRVSRRFASQPNSRSSVLGLRLARSL